MVTGLLLSRTCTTGWSDWNHGDLLLTAEALVRVRLGRPTDEGMHSRDTVGAVPQHRELPSPAEAHKVLAADRTNRYILMSAIDAARLHRGILSDRLSLRLTDGTRFKLLWLRADPAFVILQRELPSLVGARFEID